MINDTRTVKFGYKTHSIYPSAEIGLGQLDVQMKLAQGTNTQPKIFRTVTNFVFPASDSSYSYFYQAEDYPVVTYLRQPLYFEVGLTRSNDPSLELILESCWATAYEDASSQPSWDVIVNTYVFLFNPLCFPLI